MREKGLSIEESGRAERYRFYRECAERLDANVVATGHTLDDQAETVLMRLIKGSSLKGACGIPPVRTETQDLKVIRPLIELEKREIVDYLKESGIDFCVDATNAEPEYFRNAVRHEVIPYLEKFNPRIKKALFNFAAHLREDFAFIQAEKARQASRIISKKGDRISLSLKDIVVQPKALVKEIVRDALNEIGAEIKKLSYAHWKEIDHFIRAKSKGNCLDLPGGIRMMRDESALHLFRLAKADREGARLKT